MESNKFLENRSIRDLERNRSLENAEKIVRKIVKNDSKNLFLKSRSTSRADINAKNQLETLHSKKVEIRYFKTNFAKTNWDLKNMDLTLTEVKRKFRLTKPKFSSVNTAESKRLSSKASPRIRRLPPPNFMKISRENQRKPNDPRVATSSRRFRNLTAFH